MGLGAFVDALFGLLALLVLLMVVFIASIKPEVPKGNLVEIRLLQSVPDDCGPMLSIIAVRAGCQIESSACAIELVSDLSTSDLTILEGKSGFGNRFVLEYSDKLKGQKDLVVLPASYCMEIGPEINVSITYSNRSGRLCAINQQLGSDPFCVSAL